MTRKLLNRLTRLHRYGERRAQVELGSAVAAHEMEQQALENIRGGVAKSAAEVTAGSADELRRHHEWALHAEAQLRQRAVGLKRIAAEVERRHEVLTDAMRERRVVERFEELVAEQERVSDRKAEQAQADEATGASWHTKADRQ